MNEGFPFAIRSKINKPLLSAVADEAAFLMKYREKNLQDSYKIYK